MRSDAERLAVRADLEACRLWHYRKDKGRKWIQDELSRIPLQLRELVRTRLNSKLSGDK
jgi:hypothetical protein